MFVIGGIRLIFLGMVDLLASSAEQQPPYEYWESPPHSHDEFLTQLLNQTTP